MDLESRLALAADESAVVEFIELHDGRLHPGSQGPEDGVRWLELTTAKDTTQRFFARVTWAVYPHQPPSVSFTAGVNDQAVVSAWPRIPGYRPESNDICKHFTAEGYAIHPEWAVGPAAWDPTGNRFLYVAETLQDDLDLSYEGRAA